MSEPPDLENETTGPCENEDVSFDLNSTLSSIVSLRTQIPEDALTASVLGTERVGHGVVIGDHGLILTIGYLITEAEDVWIVAGEGKAASGHVVGYDQETGFGLVQALQPLSLPIMTVGDDSDLKVADRVIVAGCGGVDQAVNAHVIAKREFAGYWEYVLDEAIFAAPAHPNWGGTALIGLDGRLYGIGSLLVQHVKQAGEIEKANMFVPIGLLEPVLQDLLTYGRRNAPARPWLGMLTQEVEDHLVIAAIYDGCPAHRADLQVGDVVVGVNGESPSGLAGMFRRVWSLGSAGVRVPLAVVRDGSVREIIVHSVDRNDCLKAAKLH
jgi:S1-C subfamily serine protease